jgi:hypothetical protein
VIVFFWLAFSVLVGLFASIRRGRSGVGWFFIAAVISPLIAGLLLLILLPLPAVRPVRSGSSLNLSQGLWVGLGILGFVIAIAIVIAIITGFIGSHIGPLP